MSKIKGKFLTDSIASENTMAISKTTINPLRGSTYIKQNIVSLTNYLESNTDGFILGFEIGGSYNNFNLGFLLYLYCFCIYSIYL